jgi:protein-S-isoprenylcysteine O-methyltransferase Ste14
MDQFPKKNILTPIGALAVAVFAICVTASVVTAGTLFSWVILGIGVVPLAVAVWAYIYFALKEPDRLQTEDYRIQKEYVARIGDSRENEITISRSPERLTANTGSSSQGGGE